METEENLIDKANQAAKRLEDANIAMAANIKKQEAWEARQLLGGQSSAGEPKQKEVSHEEKVKADTLAMFKGTAVEDALKNDN